MSDENQETINQGYFLAIKLEDGSPGRPLGGVIEGGEEDGAIMLFEELDKAIEVRDKMVESCGPLSVFKINLTFAGEVIL